MKSEENILKSWRQNNTNHHLKKRFKSSSCEIDSIMYEWFSAVRLKNISISGPIIQVTLEIENFKASNGWLEKFKLLHNISCKLISGESADVSIHEANEWKNKLKNLCSGYAERDIYNCDENGLVFRALPSKTLCEKSDKSFGGKTSKQRLTVLLCANIC